MDFLRLLAQMRTPLLNTLMLCISYLGTPFVAGAVIGWYYLNVDKEEAYGMGLSFCFSCLACQAIKVIFRIPRPWNIDTQFKPAQSAVSSSTGYSFPSIHTQSATALFSSIFYRNKKKVVRILCVVLLLLVAFSRMYLGCHTPLDVGAAFGITIVITAVTWFFWNHARNEKKGFGVFAFFLLAFAVLSVFLTTALLFNGTIDYTSAADSYKTAGMSVGFAIAILTEPRALRFCVKGSLGKKILRFVIAVAGVLAIEFGMKALPTSSSIPLLILRYCLLIVWMTVATPLISMRVNLMEREEVPFRTPDI